MRIAKEDIPIRFGAPGVVARQKVDFGSASGFSMLSGEYFSLAAGTDITPLLQGLQGDLCQSPHWGYLIQGIIAVTYSNGEGEDVHGGDLFYWPPGHTLAVSEDAEIILFSPQHEHGQVMDHIVKKMGAQ